MLASAVVIVNVLVPEFQAPVPVKPEGPELKAIAGVFPMVH